MRATRRPNTQAAILIAGILPAAILLVPAAPALAQDATATLAPRSENGRQIYDAAQFARFAPQNAGDMVRQIPGFTITDTSNDRGLGEASQNVLINGQRIAGKSNDARTAIDRIPADSVIRIEIADGATLNVTGLSGQVLNLVTRPDSFSGNWFVRPEIRTVGNHHWYAAEINASGKALGGDFTLGLSNANSGYGGGHGVELVRDAAGVLLYTRDARRRFKNDRPRLSASFSRTAKNGNILNLNGAAEIFRFVRNVHNRRFAPGTADILESDTGGEREWNFETSGDYEFKLGGGRLKLIGFHRFEHSPFRNTFRLDFTDGMPAQGTRFLRTIDEGETVARGEYRWKAGAADWQISGEGALNYLDAQSALFDLDAQGAFRPVPLPGSTARVEEKRAQAILSHGRPLSPSLTMQATLGGEFSQLSQTGPNGLTRRFWRPKGSVSLAWKAAPGTDVSARLQRKVGQLDFGDFIASVDVTNNTANGSNPDLVPPQSWLAELEVNRSLGKAGSVKLKLEAEKLTDIVDQIPLSPTSEAPGNLDSAVRYLAEINATFLLDAIGWAGAKLDARALYQKSRLRDPLTGLRRPFSEEQIALVSLDLRHDIPGTDLAWGSYIEMPDVSPNLRLDYRFHDAPDRPFMLVFAEHKDVLGMKLRVQVNNVLNQKARFYETFYAARRNGPVLRTERMHVAFGQEVRFQLSGTF